MCRLWKTLGNLVLDEMSSSSPYPQGLAVYVKEEAERLYETEVVDDTKGTASFKHNKTYILFARAGSLSSSSCPTQNRPPTFYVIFVFVLFCGFFVLICLLVFIFMLHSFWEREKLWILDGSRGREAIRGVGAEERVWSKYTVWKKNKN